MEQKILNLIKDQKQSVQKVTDIMINNWLSNCKAQELEAEIILRNSFISDLQKILNN